MGLVKLAHLPINMIVCLSHVSKESIFPKLFPIPDFNVSETIIEVEIQRMKKDILIWRKVICPTIISPVTIAKENEF